jgi:NADPH-dependent 2,4-dienoyl-CoA reductase/sulfur reductase-like enzyme
MEESEIIVIGGGPAGLSAALAAARAGVQVTLIDAYAHPGGQYYHQSPERLAEHSNAHQRQGMEMLRKVKEAGVRIFSETLVSSIDLEKTLVCNSPQAAHLQKAKKIIIASGAYEQPLPFPGWTLPGVIMTGGIQTLLHQHVLPGKRLLLTGTGPLQLVVAKNLIQAGAEVVAVLEGNQLIKKAGLQATAMWGQWERMAEGSQSILTMITHGVPYRLGWGIVKAHGTSEVTGATIARLDQDWRPIKGTEQEVVCDAIGTAYGFVPFNSLSKIAGAQQAWQPELGGEVPIRNEYFETTMPGIYAVGDGAGIGGFRMSEMEGELAGIWAAKQLGHEKQPVEGAISQLRSRIRQESRFQRLYANLFNPGPGAFEMVKDDTIVCRCENITYARLRDAILTGDLTPQEIKNDIRASMGRCQGRVCSRMVLHTLARMSGKTVAEIGMFGVRPPVFPLSIGVLASLDAE